MEEKISPFSIMSATVPKCLWSELLSLSHFSLHLSLWSLDLCLSQPLSIS